MNICEQPKKAYTICYTGMMWNVIALLRNVADDLNWK